MFPLPPAAASSETPMQRRRHPARTREKLLNVTHHFTWKEEKNKPLTYEFFFFFIEYVIHEFKLKTS